MAVSFPSTEYFEALKEQMVAAQEHFSRLGFIDTTFGVSVANNGKPHNFVLEFEVFELKNVQRSPRHRFEEGRFLDRGRYPASGAR